MKRRESHSPRSTLLVTGAALAAASLLAACGSDDKESSDSSKPKAVALTLTQSGKKFTMKAPSSVDGGLAKVSLANQGKVLSDAQLVRVEGTHSQAEVLKVVNSDGGPTPEWLRAAGGPSSAAPGKTSTSTEVLKPGTYYALSTGDAPGGKSVGELGGVAKFTVKGGDSSGKLPSTSATIDAKEYSFTTTGLKAGKNSVTFANKGKELHHALLFPLNKGATIDDVRKFATSNGQSSGPPPINFEQGQESTVLDGGTSQVTQYNLHKGKYAVLCFISDRKGGPPHVAKGMLDEVDVK
jgi:hypothetical protein